MSDLYCFYSAIPCHLKCAHHRVEEVNEYIYICCSVALAIRIRQLDAQTGLVLKTFKIIFHFDWLRVFVCTPEKDWYKT